MVYSICKAVVHRGEHRTAESPVQFRATCLRGYTITVCPFYNLDPRAEYVEKSMYPALILL